MLIYGTGDTRQQAPCAPFVKNASAMFGFSQGCLPLRRWDELNAFFQKTGYYSGLLSFPAFGQLISFRSCILLFFRHGCRTSFSA
jgi:hypothetical protein